MPKRLGGLRPVRLAVIPETAPTTIMLNSFRSTLDSFRSWLADNPLRQALIGAASLLAFLGVTLGGLAASGALSGGSSGTALETMTPAPTRAATPTPTPPPTPTPTPTSPPTEPTLLNGRLVYPEEFAEIQGRLPLAIMFDNFTNARPQIGLQKADIVFEAVAEAGITRFLGVFWTQEPGQIEAVRSARAYYLDWAAGMDAIYVHWGRAESSNPAADVSSSIARLGIRHFDGFVTGPPYFARDPNRVSPHNGIANTDALWEFAVANGWNGPPAIEPWQFKDDEPSRANSEDALAAPAIDLGFGGPYSPDYSVRWQYDKETNGYRREMAGQPHEDGASGEQIQARNIAVVVTSKGSANDGTDHIVYQTTGSGDAVVFQDGVAIPGTWSKPDAHSRIRFFDAAGNEIPFNRGHTWIEVLSFGDPLLY